VKLASSTDIQAAVILHPGQIADNEIDGKSPTPQVHAKYVLLMSCCLRC
jgi:hypothetical protein